MNDTITLRPVRWPEDKSFLQALYASTRAEELANVPWTDEQKEAFCRMQFAAQHQHYQEHYVGASFDVIELDGQPIGRLYVARWENEIRIVDWNCGFPAGRMAVVGVIGGTGLQGPERPSLNTLADMLGGRSGLNCRALPGRGSAFGEARCPRSGFCAFIARSSKALPCL